MKARLFGASLITIFTNIKLQLRFLLFHQHFFIFVFRYRHEEILTRILFPSLLLASYKTKTGTLNTKRTLR
jgi:hypothetical protein